MGWRQPFTAISPSFPASLGMKWAALSVWTEHNGTRCMPASLRRRSSVHCLDAEIRCRDGDEDTFPGKSIERKMRSSLAGSSQTGSTSTTTRGCWASHASRSSPAEHEQAAHSFETALADAESSDDEQQLVLSLALATACAPDRRRTGVKSPCEAIDTLQRDFYPTARERLPAVRDESSRRSAPGRAGGADRGRRLAPVVLLHLVGSSFSVPRR